MVLKLFHVLSRSAFAETPGGAAGVEVSLHTLTLGWTLSFDSDNPISSEYTVNNYKIITPVQHPLGSIQ